jgi:CelD/BcsL family acetyltransferase involved in cellulose biosynthesis
MKVISIEPYHDPIWRKLVLKGCSDVFQSPEWIKVIVDTYGFDTRANVLFDDDGEPVAGIPFSHIEDVRGERTVSLPFSDYCDPLVNTTKQWSVLTETLLTSSTPLKMRCLHNEIPLSDKRLDISNKAKWHGIDLSQDPDQLWSGFHSSARRAIKKAQRNGMVVRIAQHREDLRAFFELHLKVRKNKYHLVAQPYSFFESIWHQFIEKERGAIFLAIQEDDIIGGVVFLEWQNKIYYKFNASDPDKLYYRPNDLVIWEGIQYGQSKGYSHFDFGLSDWNQEGLLRYKRKYATEEKTIFFLSNKSDGGQSNQATELGNLFHQLTDLFTDESVPNHVTEKAGEVLYRYFT